jgi:mono/diheme cytochrome c family protein
VNSWIVILVLGAVAALRFTKLGILTWQFVWLAAAFIFFKFALVPALPSTAVFLYMTVTALTLLAYVSFDSERWESVKSSVTGFFTEEKYSLASKITLVALPLLVGLYVYINEVNRTQAPSYPRVVNPKAPQAIVFKEKTIKLLELKNPFRKLEQSDSAGYSGHLSNGKRVYYENCVFCHGPELRGKGHFSHGFSPAPTSFADPAILKNRTEPYLFWRIAKGPDMPEQGEPWATSMPAWEPFLTEDEIWDVILYLYDFTGYKPLPSGK